MNIPQILNQVYILPYTSLEHFIRCFNEVKYPKSSLLYEEFKRGQNVFLIKEGIVRAYSLRDGRDITFWFGSEGGIVFPMQTFYGNQGEYSTVELLTDCTLYEIPVDKLKRLYATDIHIANWGRRYAEKACIESERMFIRRQFKTSLERYQDLMEECPTVISHVPLGLIASYLGISQVSLSRIRALIK